MSSAAPIDATTTPAWEALSRHYDNLQREGIDLKAWFAADPDRVKKMTFDVNDLRVDLSKNLVTDTTRRSAVRPRRPGASWWTARTWWPTSRPS